MMDKKKLAEMMEKTQKQQQEAMRNAMKKK
jgi:hypothetical protein